MALTTRETIIANPGGRMAHRKLSKKQIAAGFGGKRRKTNAKKRKSSASSHRPRTKPKANAPKKRNSHRKSSAPRAKKHNRAPRKRNLGGIFALTGNPAKGHRMKTTKKNKKRKSSAKSNAGYYHKKKNPGRRHNGRHNPGGFGSPMEWLTGGVGAVIGGVGAPALTQLALGTSNTGAMGYFGNAVAVAILAAAARFAAPRQQFLMLGIVFGGVGSIIRRVIGDYSLLGSYSSSVGMGDYLMNFNYPIPQYLLPGNNRALTASGAVAASQTPSIPVNVAGAGMGASLYGARLYN
jgi:hypothetical protein